MAIDPRIKAAHAWPLLVQVAAQRSTVPVDDLAKRVGAAPHRLKGPLEAITLHCKKNGLPDLSSIVLRKGGVGDTIDEIRGAVYNEAWGSVVNPFRVFLSR